MCYPKQWGFIEFSGSVYLFILMLLSPVSTATLYECSNMMINGFIPNTAVFGSTNLLTTTTTPRTPGRGWLKKDFYGGRTGPLQCEVQRMRSCCCLDSDELVCFPFAMTFFVTFHSFIKFLHGNHSFNVWLMNVVKLFRRLFWNDLRSLALFLWTEHSLPRLSRAFQASNGKHLLAPFHQLAAFNDNKINTKSNKFQQPFDDNWRQQCCSICYRAPKSEIRHLK